MLIVWGTKQIERKSGWVADYCPICDGAQACRLVELRMVSHVYYIPLGRGQVVGHLRQCRICKHKFVTDAKKYKDVSKDKNASIEALTDTTHPELIESMAEWLDLREQAVRGDANDDDRREMLFHPFLSLVYPIAQRGQGIHMDGRSLLWLLFLIVAPFVTYFGCTAIKARWMDDTLAFGLTFGVGLLALILLIFSLHFDSTRYVRRYFQPFILKFLAPLNPTIEELRDVITTLKHDADAHAVGKHFKPERLHLKIALYRDNCELEL